MLIAIEISPHFALYNAFLLLFHNRWKLITITSGTSAISIGRRIFTEINVRRTEETYDLDERVARNKWLRPPGLFHYPPLFAASSRSVSVQARASFHSVQWRTLRLASFSSSNRSSLDFHLIEAIGGSIFSLSLFEEKSVLIKGWLFSLSKSWRSVNFRFSMAIKVKEGFFIIFWMENMHDY